MIAKRHILLLLLLTAGLLLTGCSSRALHEAQDVVKTADSLRAEGVAYTDSMALAEAYNTLEKWQYLYPTDYARVCYYYGRLLRNNDDPVAAMQVFINATHTNTRDYHILGRTYSNMGSICHLANEFQLSYDMYSCSANMFLKNGDTLRYYFALNEMALECAAQGDKEATLSLTNRILQACNNEDLQAKVYETQAEMYLQVHQYDSALILARGLCKDQHNEPTGLVICAQAYSLMGNKDSATLYANAALRKSLSPYNIYNLLYISTNDDISKDLESVRKVAADRADLQKVLLSQRGDFSQAVQLLEQDIQRVPIWPWIVIAMSVQCLAGGIILLSRYKKKQQHKLLSQQILYLQNKADMTQSERKEEMERQCALFASSPTKSVDLCWKDYDAMCNVVNQHFLMLARKLQQENLTEKEIRLCILSLLNLGYEEMANMLCYAPNGVGKLKMRTAKKLGTTAKKLRDFLVEKAIFN